MHVIGIDIGTTSICAIAVDIKSGKVLETINVDNDSNIESSKPYEKIQNPEHIANTIFKIYSMLEEKYSPISGIGFSGQMHGIVYLDKNGKAVSPLYTWQDGRGDLIYKDDKTYAQMLSELTGYKLATGYGSVTHYYNSINGLVPNNAIVFCTIHDYIAITLANETKPLTHISDAASFGLFDLNKGDFDTEAIAKAGMDLSYFPKVTSECKIIGRTSSDVPVSAAIGDNQASYAGSVADDNSSVLVNIGTGSQISYYSQSYRTKGILEARPFSSGSYLLVGSPLCGGRAYALLESFFKSVVNSAGYECESMFPVINKLAENFESIENELQIETLFCGTRENPTARASITNLGLFNFTPEHFAVGVLWGIVNELYEKYIGETENSQEKASVLIGSGNGIRKNTVMQKMLEKKFGMELKIPVHKEEAAYGAALFSMVASGEYKDIDEARKIINYI